MSGKYVICEISGNFQIFKQKVHYIKNIRFILNIDFFMIKISRYRAMYVTDCKGGKNIFLRKHN